MTDEEACKAVIGAQPQRAETGRVDQTSITQPRGFAGNEEQDRKRARNEHADRLGQDSEPIEKDEGEVEDAIELMAMHPRALAPGDAASFAAKRDSVEGSL